MIADLHMHSLYSDGQLTPKALVSTCKALKIPIISITDHDNVGAVDIAIQEGIDRGIKVIPGIELSSYGDSEVHILGYNIDYKNKGFVEKLNKYKSRRNNRNLEIIDRLANLGIKLDYNSMIKDGASTGRLHIAREMLEKGYVCSVNEAFDKYLGQNGSCYIKSSLITPQDAVDLVNEYNGLAVLAHPYRFVEEGRIRDMIKTLKGLSGIETWYPSHTDCIRQEIIALAQEYNLITTGGSDFHSPNHGSPLGSSGYQLDDKTAQALGVTI